MAECEGNQFINENYGGYSDCTAESTQSACLAVSGCKWFDTFCGNEGYNPDSYGGSGSSGTTSSEMARCFYPNATINGTPPGYTVWCEKDYVNCHKGDPSGEAISTEGLALGAPSTCETGWNSNYGPNQTCTGTSESSCTSEANCYWQSEASYCFYDSDGDPTTKKSNQFLGAVAESFSDIFKNLKDFFSF